LHQSLESLLDWRGPDFENRLWYSPGKLGPEASDLEPIGLERNSSLSSLPVDEMVEQVPPLGLFIQPACLQHKYIRHANSSHIFERPERLRAVLLGVAAAVARLEEAETAVKESTDTLVSSAADDLSSMLSGLSIQTSFTTPRHLSIVSPPPAKNPAQVLLHHPALQLAHSPPSSSLLDGQAVDASKYLKNLHKWASEAVETIKQTGCEIPPGLGLNQGDLYLGPGSILAIEGAVS
jgi:histone deacetylase HOS3